MKLPAARTKEIVVQELGKEVLIYNLLTHKAYNLNETSAVVYQHCDGKTSFDELKRDHKFTDDLIYLALDELKKNNLIEDNSFVSPFNGLSRREVIRRVGFASMIALPVISSLVAPTAAMAQSSAGTTANCQPCSADAECASGNCARSISSSGSICSAASSIVNAGSPSFVGFGSSTATCSASGAMYCCNGTATFTPPSTCRCN